LHYANDAKTEWDNEGSMTVKARCIIYCALIALAVFSASADSDIAIVGDANSDGSITTADSMFALRMAVGGMAPDIARADVNYDGDVNSLDDEDQTVHLYIDGDYKKYMSIASDRTGYYDKYEFEDDEDALHSFKIIWLDPETDEEYQKITRSYITGEEALTLYIDKHTKEDMILLSNETPTPVSTPAQSTGNSQPSVRNTASSTTFHTDPAPPENSAGNNGSGPGITPLYTLIGLLAVMFALVQIRRS